MDEPKAKRQRIGGRKPLDPNDETIGVTIKMTKKQQAKLTRLGGPQWVRDRIDKAKDQDPQ